MVKERRRKNLFGKGRKKQEVNPLNDQEEANFQGLQNFLLRDLIKKSRVVKDVRLLEQNQIQTDRSERSQLLDLEGTGREVLQDSKKKEVTPHQERTGFRGQEISLSQVSIATSHEVKESPHLEENQIQDRSATAKSQSHSPAKEMMIKINLLAIKDFLKEKADFLPLEKRSFLSHLKKEKKVMIGFQNSKEKMKNRLERNPIAILILKKPPMLPESRKEKKENLKTLLSQKKKNLLHLDLIAPKKLRHLNHRKWKQVTV